MSRRDDEDLVSRLVAGSVAGHDDREPNGHNDGPERAGSPTLLFIGVVVVIAGIGFLAGTRTRPKPAGYQTGGPATEAASGAPSYADLRSQRWGVNAGMYEHQVKGLALSASVGTEPAKPASAAERREALISRSERRAYAGAPPVIPHAIDQRGLPSCLSCHLTGAVAAGRLAPMMSHAPLQSCVQCHAPGIVPEPLAESPMAENQFLGESVSGGGSRAWIGAPPTMPHPSFMRERCTSCHGVASRPGLRSPHLERSNCQQCHAPSAALDQRNDPSWVGRNTRAGERAL